MNFDVRDHVIEDNVAVDLDLGDFIKSIDDQFEYPKGLFEWSPMLNLELTISKRHLNLPIENVMPKRAMKFLVNGKNVRDLIVHLAEAEPNCWVFADVKCFIGQSLTIEAKSGYIEVDALDAITQSDTPLADIEGELFDIRVEFELWDASEFGINVRGTHVCYDVAFQELCLPKPAAPLVPKNGKIHLRLLIDRPSIEVFENNGEVAYPLGFLPEANGRSLKLYTKAGNTRMRSREVYELRSIWL